ncbi:MAG: 4Fe-4S binding protein [Bacteroidales bacterium]
MKINKLVVWRRLSGLMFFLLLLLAFTDFAGILPTGVIRWPGYLQFVPSLLKFLYDPSILATGFLIILLLTIIWGRIYCSWICPLGVLQDLLGRFRNWKSKKKKKYRTLPSLRALRYTVLVIVTLLLLAGIMQPLVLTDPYSLFGKIMHNLLMPALMTINNQLSSFLVGHNIYFAKPYPAAAFHQASLWFSLAGAGLLLFLSVKYGRIYCTAWCPVGTLLGLFSRLSLFSLKISEDSCTSCGLCARACKAGCIDYHKLTIDFERCVGCFNCLGACPSHGISFQRRKAKAQNVFEPARRQNLHWLMLGTGGLILEPQMAKAETLQKALVPSPRRQPVLPPGAVSLERFNTVCTACHLCVSTCPTRVLRPSFLEYGLKGLFQPMLDYQASFCNFECTRCGEVCPTGAITHLLPEEKKITQLGIAAFQKLNCVVYTHETACGACSEHCPTKAVHMVSYKNGLLIPEVNTKICIGCGACEYACPTQPYKAIYVQAHAIHAKASPPEKSPQSKEEIPEEFPF